MATNFTPGGNVKRGAPSTQNRANDDKTNKKKTGTVKRTPVPPPVIPPVAGAVDQTQAESNRLANAGTAGTTQAGKSDTEEAKPNIKDEPGKRWKNPLGNFSSYTYQISLYMITPDAYEAFIASGRRDINAINNLAGGQEAVIQANEQSARDVQTSNNSPTRSSGSPPASSSTSTNTIRKGAAYLIAQSGGINNSGPNQRAPGFDLDFYIDDLTITQAISAKETQSATNITDITFKITEPYGFSFLTRLKKAQAELKNLCSTPGYEDISNPIKQFYILGIRFLGYDVNGNIIDPASIKDSNGNDIGTGLGLYERYFDIILSKMDFKLGGQSVTYNCEAKSVPGSEVFGTKRGIVWSGASVSGKTVYDALLGGSGLTNTSKPGESNMASSTSGESAGSLGLLTTLNREQQKRLNNKEIEYANEWNISWLGDSFDAIGKATIISPSDVDKRRTPTTTATSTAESNAVTAQASSKPNTNLKTISLGKGIPIIQGVDEIVKQSSFLEDALNLVIRTDTDNNTKTDGSPSVTDNSDKSVEVRWYNLSAEVVIKAWDKKQNDFVFKTNFIIQPYSTPVTVSAYSGKTTPYYGPHKRYEYWHTGKNTEVLKFEQTFNNAFFNVAIEGAGVAPTATAGTFDIPVVVGQPTGQSIQGRPNYNLETQNSYISSLYDPGAWAETNMTILGDPDFLMQPAASSISTLYNKFYGTDEYTVSPNGGQVFVEINFREPTDYDNNKGIMNINDSVNIYPHPKYIQKKINERGGGIALMLKSVTSKFSKGTFTQDLVGFPGAFADDPKDEVNERQTDAQSPFAAFSQVKTVPTTNSGAGTTAASSAAKTNQVKTRTGTTTPTTPRFTPGGNAKRGGVTTGTAPTTTGQGTTVKSVASAEVVKNLGVNKPLTSNNNVAPVIKPVQDQTILNKQGVQNDDAGTTIPIRRIKL